VRRLVKRSAKNAIDRLDVLAERGVGELVQGLESLADGDLTERLMARRAVTGGPR
jgi:hypothetical protein